MTITYELRIHSRDVTIDLNPWEPGETILDKHTGYELIGYDETGRAVSIQTVDLNAINVLTGPIDFKTLSSSLDLPVGSNVVPPKIYQNGAWIDVTPKWLEDNHYKSVNIPVNSDEAQQIFEKINDNAKLINKLKDIGLSISYDPMNQNCNSWATYINDNLFPESSIYDLLGAKPNEYVGGGNSFPAFSSGVDVAIIKALEGLLKFLEDNNLPIDEVNIEKFFSLSDLQFLISFNNLSYEFKINTEPYIETTIHYNTMPELNKLFGTAETARSPLVIDLDGDGVETVGTDANIHFDHDGNGFAENTGWASPDDGILIHDINNNGIIDNGTELFGNNSVLSNGHKASNGFEALKDLDSNKDGIFNASDIAFNDVKIWKDTNQNGILDNGELLSLEQAGISCINLIYQDKYQEFVNTHPNPDGTINVEGITDANNNHHLQLGSFVKNDGTSSTINDVWFDVDTSNSVNNSNVEVSENIKALPNIEGSGNLYSLQETMQLDTSGELKALVEQFATETNYVTRQNILTSIIYHWAGVQDVNPESRASNNPSYGNAIGDARKLEALEEFLGKEFKGTWCWGDRDPNPHGKAAVFLIQAFNQLANYINTELMMQTHFKDTLENITLTWNQTTSKWDIDVTQAINQLQTIYNNNNTYGESLLMDLGSVLNRYTSIGEDVCVAFKAFGNATGNTFEVLLYGLTLNNNVATLGNDDLLGTDNADTINALAGNDSINTGSGDDILIGGAGNDYLNGGKGNDIYLFNVGFGHDSIDNDNSEIHGTSQDIIQFGADILPDNVTYYREGVDLIIKVSENDTLRVYSYFDLQGTTNSTVNLIKFDDGTELNYSQIFDIVNSSEDAGQGIIREGTNNYDTITATNNNDIIIANGGDDNINANWGNDLVIGGAGNDSIYDDGGDDTYIYNLGDGFDIICDLSGNDTLSFGPGIRFSDLTFKEGVYGHLNIYINGDINQGIQISEQLYLYGTRKIEKLKFYDGTVVRLTEIGLTLHQDDTAEVLGATPFDDVIYAKGGDDNIKAGNGNDKIYGEAGNDTLIGGLGDDIIIGEIGNDILQGEQGNNTYIYNLGDGLDTITSPNYNFEYSNQIKFGAGISKENLTFRYQNYNLQIIINGDENQGIIIDSFFYGQEYKFKYLEFADGSSINLYEEVQTLSQGNGNDIVIMFNHENYIVNGNAGDDTINLYSGNDIINGGIGNDILEGSSGDDTYIYNLGDGVDTIKDWNSFDTSNDRIKFGPGITFEDLRFINEDGSIRIVIKNDFNQSILIHGFYQERSYESKIETLEFADGTTKDLANSVIIFKQTDIDDNVYGTRGDDIIYGNGGNDIINGGEGNDILYGNEGNDTLIGNWGDNTLIGGAGNDILEGNLDNDTYIYNLGDGFDTIYDNGRNDKIIFGEGINQNNISFSRDEYNLKISINGNENQGMEIDSYFYTNDYKIETIEFADGTTMDISNADQLIQAMSSFGINNAALSDSLSNPTQNISEIYNLAANSYLTPKAI